MAEMFVGKLAFRHCQKVRLMLRTADQQADMEAGAANVLNLLRVGCHFGSRGMFHR